MWLLRTPKVVQIEDCVLKPAICARRAAAGANSLIFVLRAHYDSSSLRRMDIQQGPGYRDPVVACIKRSVVCISNAEWQGELKPSLDEVPLSWDPQMQVINGKIRVIRIIAAADMTFRPGRVSNQSVQTKVKISRWEHRSPAPGGVMGGRRGGGTHKQVQFGYI
ncbi:uncharacterized protein BO96DRAFT_385940 [Aspergillus niger CBS 101883]|uniref:Uncharacterized protein n=2 Tax=Aspergillus niger TaxID=5061 RepID=A2QEI8_ASPNC|nr:uncharacterized protein BO96DRAFT_385940 [Aspergillus niger CBS 101883]XP_059603501.1 hypothetical protein An02g11250 [Aspergillus niger]PYH59887.1 hypothetical protein BO96DRAFT_385940 [Aspergillus niger CBS 101883]CAK44455.1 hypothetical protein An02g11250 [Aspergillus niger]